MIKSNNKFHRFFMVPITLFGLVACFKEYPKPTGAAPYTSPVVTPPAGSPANNSFTYLALGDSYTIGQNVTADNRFPAQTVAILKQANVSISDPIYIAATGWTTTNLSAAISAASLQPPYDVVSLLIGVNDQYQSRDTTNYRTRFTSLLNKSIELSGNRKSRVFVLSIPDYSVTPFVSESNKAQVSKEIDLFNQINKEVCLQQNISYTDITPASREALTNRSLIANDSLHPSGLQYKMWADLLAPKIKSML